MGYLPCRNKSGVLGEGVRSPRTVFRYRGPQYEVSDLGDFREGS